MLRGCLVCVICKSNSIRSYILKLCIMIVHIEVLHLPVWAHLINIFQFLTGVELRHFFLPKCLGAPSVCNLELQKYSFLYIQTLHNDCSHIEDVHRLFNAHLTDIFFIFGGS